MRQDREQLLDKQPREKGRFAPVGSEQLSKRVRGVRLPQSIDEAIEEYLPQPQQAEWLRRVICEAVQRELLTDTEKS